MQIATTTNTTYYDYSATPGKRYYYWVNIVYMGSERHNANRYDWGTRLTPSIPEPPQPSASTIYSSYVRVSWSSVANVTKYVIRRSTNSNYRDSIQLATTTSTTYYDYSAIAGKTYYYWINVISKGVEYSNASRYDWGRKYIDTLVVPQPTASISYISYIRVGWSSSTGATKYVIRRSLTSNYDNSIVVGTTTNTYYYDYPPLRNTRYYYWVNPVDNAGNIYFNRSKYDYGWRR
jgi:fibronectin type 3 domain-containing protein